jgi:uncharacterized protein YdgA (DUF945 family)
MKRWLVVLLVVLALVVLISPGIVGRMAEDNLNQEIDWVESESPGVSISTETFDRGWFTSEGRHRVFLEGGQFREMSKNYQESTGHPDMFSLVIDTKLDHGLIPLSSMTPGLASTVSTFHLDPGNGELVELPGTLTSNVSLTGAADSTLVVEQGSYQIDDATINWEGANLDILFDQSGGAMSAHGTISPISISDANGGLDIGAIAIDADQTITDYGFNVGPVKVSVDTISAQTEEGAFTIGGISLDAESSIDDGRLNSGGSFEIDGIEVPGFGNVEVMMDVAMNGLDAAALGAVAEVLKEAQSGADPAAALQMMYPQIESDLQTLVTRGAEINLNQLDVSLPQGKITSSLSVEVPEGDADADFSWATILLNAKASLNLRVPVALYDMAAMMNPQANSLVAMGMLIKDGEEYVMAAEYEQGLVNVNGAPMPLPIPGL